MNTFRNPYLQFLLLLTIVGTWIILTAEMCMEIMFFGPGIYDDSEYWSFVRFISSLSFISLLFGLSIKIKTVDSSLTILGLSILCCNVLMSIIIGYWFTYDTRSDEYLYFFLFSVSSIPWYVLIAGSILRNYFTQFPFPLKHFFLSIFSGLIIGYILLTGVRVIPYLTLIHYPMIITGIILVSIYVVQSIRRLSA